MTTIPMKEVAAFLLGEDSLDGYWFGERHPTERGQFWWRKHLRAALSAPATAPAWHVAQQAEIESLRWTVKDALESLDNGMTADCRATLSSATKETP